MNDEFFRLRECKHNIVRISVQLDINYLVERRFYWRAFVTISEGVQSHNMYRRREAGGVE